MKLLGRKSLPLRRLLLVLVLFFTFSFSSEHQGGISAQESQICAANELFYEGIYGNEELQIIAKNEEITCPSDEETDEDMFLDNGFQDDPDSEEDGCFHSSVSVEEFGAKGDGETDDSKAFEKAWKAACECYRSTVIIPEGKRYLVKPITFSGPCQNPMTVQIKGEILAPADPNAWEGQNTRLWLLFKNINDLTVHGGGIIDGSGKAWWEKSCKVNKTNPCSHAPTAVTFEMVNNLRVRSVRVQNAQQMHIVFQKCNAVQASNIDIESPHNSPNTDGIHVTASKAVSIKRSTIATGDDCISIVSGCDNIEVSEIRCGPGHGISIGSLGQGNSEAQVSNVFVQDCYLKQTTNGLRIKTWQGGSGYAKATTFKNVKMENVSNPIIIDQYYCDSTIPCPEQKSAVKVSNVMYKNIRGTTSTKEAIKLLCSRTVACEGIFMQNINIQLEKESDKATSRCINALGTSKGTVIPPPCLSSSSLIDSQYCPASNFDYTV